MTTPTFYGHPIAATARNVKLLTLVFFPAILILSWGSFFLSAWALSDFLGIGVWLTLPLLIALGLEVTINSRTLVLLPKVLRKPILFGFNVLALHVFWTDESFILFSFVALFVVHVIAHQVLPRCWASKRAKAAEAAERECIKKE